MLPCAWGIHFANGESLGWKFAWFRIRAKASGKLRVFVNRAFEPLAPERGNAERLQAKPREMDVREGQHWVKMPFTCLRELRFELSSDIESSCDVAVFTKDESFDVSSLDAEALRAVPRRPPRKEPADRLFELNPTMPLREYAEKVARLHGSEPRPPVPMWDGNGAVLHDGKPYFPLMIYHSTCNRSEGLLADVPLNIFPDRIPPEPSPYPRMLLYCGLMFRDRSYSEFFAIAQGQSTPEAVRRNAIAYLFDEPDCHYDAIAQRRLHELFKVVVPETPTLFCNCCFASLGEQCRACDYPCFDHYPIGRSDPWFSIEAIRYVIAKCRIESGNAPTLFAVQTYAQEKFMPFEGGKFNPKECGLPTERELAAMTFLPVAVGAKGLFFFNFRELYGTDPKTLPEVSPEFWAQLKNFIRQLHAMEDVLTGPEVVLPWAVSGEASVRILVSSDRKRGYLLAVNPTLHSVTERLAPVQSFPLKGCGYTEVFNYGATAEFASKGDVILRMEALSSVLYRLSPEGLAALRMASKSEVFAELNRWVSRGLCTDEATRLGHRGQLRPAAPEKAQHFEHE